jgi:cadmium resistance protein CadD (predicted permease)
MKKMTLRERWNARESRLGLWIKTFIGYVGILTAAVGGALEYLALVPQDWIPTWIKTMVLISGVVGYVIGKLTTKKEKSKEPETINT